MLRLASIRENSRLRRFFSTVPAGLGPITSPLVIAGCDYWLKADALSQADNTAVTSWPDGSTSGRSNTPPGSSNQPKFRTAVQNGLPGIQFDGTDDSFNSTAPATSRPFTLFAVVQPTSNASGGVIVGAAAIAGLEWRILQTSNKANLTTQFTADIATGTAAMSMGSSVMLGVTWDASGNIAFYKNGGADGTASSSTTPATSTVTLGRNGYGANEFFTGYMFEIIRYTRVLTTVERQQVESYLRARWGTP